MYSTILVVDDSATSRMIIKKCFQMAGLEDSSFLEAEDGLKAAAMLQDQKVDLILTDLKMPKMDGVTFIKKLRVWPTTKDTPVIVISSMGSDVSEVDLKAHGVICVLKKPLSPESVARALEDG
jgi:CheY-like chemotaxis protein